MRSLLSLTALLSLISALPAEETLSRLVYSDQTTISGTVSEIDTKSETLTLTSPFLKGETQLKTDSLLELKLNLKAEIPEADHHALATIAPHFEHPMQDTIRGRLIGVDADTVTLKTWYAGQLKLKRSMIRGLDIYANAPSLYNGPNSLDHWVTPSGKPADSWTLKKGSLISRSRTSIARKIEIGERSKLSFRVQWRNYPYFRVSFLANSGTQNYPSIGYTLQVQQSYLNLNRNGGDRQRNEILGESTQQLRNQESAIFEIYLDRRPEGKNAFAIDGKLIKEWEGTDDTQKMGEWIIFGTQSNNPIKISDISVSLWDGRVPTHEESAEPEESIFEGMEGQRIDLANGDALFGKITKVEDGLTSIQTSLGNVTIPVSRLRSFQLHPKAQPKGEDEDETEEGEDDKKEQEPEVLLEEPRRWTEDVRAWFSKGGYVTLRLNTLTEKKITGYSQVFGDAEFDLSAFSHIEFNIWDDDLNEERSGADSDW